LVGPEDECVVLIVQEAAVQHAYLEESDDFELEWIL
jgi:hypothetical protein